MPAALALRNEAIFGPTPLRVIPDISMDADAQTGMLIGLTQTFPNGTYYGQFKEGGTSLASPLLAGVIADTDQAAGVSEGFLNPTLYKAYSGPRCDQGHRAAGQPAAAAVIRVDYANTVRRLARLQREPAGHRLRGPGDVLRRHRQLCDAARHADDREGIRQPDRSRVSGAVVHR